MRKVVVTCLEPGTENIKKVLLAGSSHTRLLFQYVKQSMKGKAVVNKLPHDAGNTFEILNSIHDWPLAEKDAVYLYAGHRDLMLDDFCNPVVSQEKFKNNLLKIIDIIIEKTSLLIVSNIPFVSDSFLQNDLMRNQRIAQYNMIIEDVVKTTGILLHDFNGIAKTSMITGKYSDGLHFTRKFYKEFGRNLADTLTKLV